MSNIIQPPSSTNKVSQSKRKNTEPIVLCTRLEDTEIDPGHISEHDQNKETSSNENIKRKRKDQVYFLKKDFKGIHLM